MRNEIFFHRVLAQHTTSIDSFSFFFDYEWTDEFLMEQSLTHLSSGHLEISVETDVPNDILIGESSKNIPNALVDELSRHDEMSHVSAAKLNWHVTFSLSLACSLLSLLSTHDAYKWSAKLLRELMLLVRRFPRMRKEYGVLSLLVSLPLPLPLSLRRSSSS